MIQFNRENTKNSRDTGLALMKTSVKGIRISEELWNLLKEASVSKGTTRNNLIVAILSYFIKKFENDKNIKNK